MVADDAWPGQGQWSRWPAPPHRFQGVAASCGRTRLGADGYDVGTVQHALGHSSASITFNVDGHLWPKAEDRTRAAAATLMPTTAGPADSVRTWAGF